jgi:UDP-N-acetylmuramoyl-tripeptide--D-alanyl-D-alanine ligase
MKLSLQQLSRTLGCRLPEHALGSWVTGVSTDTRSIAPGDCFVALRGDNFDGHHFIPQAIEAGARIVVCDHTDSDPNESGEVTMLVVPDTLFALGEIARLWRFENHHVPTAAIVGSNGKTTTKEMMAALLGGGRELLVTEGNLNNLVGVPRMVFGLRPDHRVAVLEAGMNQAGELGRLVGIIQPQCVALTNISNAHVGNFGSQEALYRAKCEALESAPADALLVMNADDKLSRRARVEFARGRRCITFGMDESADVRATDVVALQPYGYAFRLHLPEDEAAGRQVELRVFGRHNISNALCAAATAQALGAAPADIAPRLGGFSAGLNRSEVEDMGGWHLVKDYYNASPAAVENALRSLQDFHVSGRRYAVLADMLELGDMEHDFHAHIGAVAAASGLDMLLTVGERAKIIHETATKAGLSAQHFADAAIAAEHLRGLLQTGDLLLVKGSRLMKLERIYDLLKETPPGGSR